MGDSSAQVLTHARIAVTTEDETVSRIANAIFEFIKIKGSATRTSVFKLVPGRRTYKIKALRSLLSSNKILRIGSGKKCDQFKYSVALTKKPVPRPATQEQAFIEEVIL